MAEPLHLQPEPEPVREHVRLGDQTLELDPESAAAVRSAFEGLAQQYGAALERYRAETLQSLGTSGAFPGPAAPAPPQPSDFGIPDPDLMLTDKTRWAEAFQQTLAEQLGGIRQEQAQMVQGAVQAFQQELARRDQAAAARSRHDAAMADMLERRGLEENTLVVQAVYDREFEKLKHLPLELALDKIGAEAEQEIARIRHGEQWTMERGPAQAVAPKPPPVLRSARRAPAAPPPPAPPPGGLSPEGGLGSMGQIIRKRQAALLGRTA